jgi:cytoskeletal protein RodZ
MAEQDLHEAQAPFESPSTVGARLKHAREAMGLSRADIAARTKIAERHLTAIEADRFADLASSTYAVGFSRAYARTVGLDEHEIAQAVRNELHRSEGGDQRRAPTFEPGDPARVPTSRTAWMAMLGAVVVIAAIFAFWRSYYWPSVSLPDLTVAATSTPAVPKPAGPVAAAVVPSVAPGGAVVFTAKEAGVWVRFSDATGKQLMQKQMALGETYTVPVDAAGPQLRTARPDALSITVGGRPVPPLADKQMVLTAPVSAAALLARGAPAPVVSGVPTAQPAPPQPAVVPAAIPAAVPHAAAPPAPKPTPRPVHAAAPRSAVPAPAATPPARPAPEAPRAAPTPAAAPAEPPKASTVSE